MTEPLPDPPPLLDAVAATALEREYREWRRRQGLEPTGSQKQALHRMAEAARTFGGLWGSWTFEDLK